jgi:V/A-type H+-transporting ATPase subunit E
MGSELLQLLEREARVERDKVLSEAREKAQEIRAAADKDAAEISGETRRGLEGERAQILNRATSAASLRAAALVLEAKDQAIREVFQRAAEELRRASEDPERRRDMLRTLLAEAIQGLQTEGAILEVPRGDAEAAREICRALGLSLEIRENPEISGGVRITTKDRRVVVENTVSSRLARTRAALVSRVAEILWGA